MERDEEIEVIIIYGTGLLLFFAVTVIVLIIVYNRRVKEGKEKEDGDE